jgi:hypothetical protein
MAGGNSKWYEMLESEQPRTVATRNVPVKRSLPEGSTPATMTASTQKKRRRNARSCVPDNVIDFIHLTPNHVSPNDNSGLFESEIEDVAGTESIDAASGRTFFNIGRSCTGASTPFYRATILTSAGKVPN